MKVVDGGGTTATGLCIAAGGYLLVAIATICAAALHDTALGEVVAEAVAVVDEHDSKREHIACFFLCLDGEVVEAASGVDALFDFHGSDLGVVIHRCERAGKAAFRHGGHDVGAVNFGQFEALTLKGSDAYEGK